MSFELAKTVFTDTLAVEWLDDRQDYGEERFVIIGAAKGEVLLYVAYTERGESIRIISARRVLTYPDVRPLNQADFTRMKRTP